MSRPGRRLRLSATAPVLLLGVVACGSVIEQGELESQIADTIQEEFDFEAEVSCPDDLEAEVDASTECTAIDPATDEEIALRITVTSVEDGTAQFDIAPVE
ncbi:DUF4333 domain-containing protein [Geodermatophilus sabuli]|uniref:DUF4333 domain-containing protein n=1 Tax=Geodermatophilus sabuli TaxID=1564158 RepID=A0A7K3W412_9ACTN|nr:DUF4333 domain-containing protein [Geodermatophilus sabuli]